MAGTSKSSGLLSTSTGVYTGRGTLNFVEVLTDGTNAATVIVYDNTAASGTVLFKAVVAGSNNQLAVPLTVAVRCDIGLYVSISGTGANAIIHWGA